MVLFQVELFGEFLAVFYCLHLSITWKYFIFICPVSLGTLFFNWQYMTSVVHNTKPLFTFLMAFWNFICILYVSVFCMQACTHRCQKKVSDPLITDGYMNPPHVGAREANPGPP